MDIYRYTMRLFVNGKKVKECFHNGKAFIESRHGTEYEIEIKNHGNTRGFVIVSVDGLCTLNGEPASDNSPGYIIEGYSVLKVKGFQQNESGGGRFRFKDNTFGGDSYAAKSGFGGNEGVIAVRVWDEKINYPSVNFEEQLVGVGKFYGGSKAGTSSVYFNANSTRFKNGEEECVGKSKFDMGTDWGSSHNQKVKKVEFERGDFVGQMSVYYASRNALLDMGVPVSSPPVTSYAFPKPFDGFDFAKAPKGWRG